MKIIAIVSLLMLSACSFALDAEKISASSKLTEAKPKKLPPATSAVYLNEIKVYA